MSRLLFVFLENGWGNMMLELATGLAIAASIKEDETQVVGLLSGAFFSTHKSVFLKEHSERKLPNDIQSIFPLMKFTSSPQYDIKLFNNHEEFNPSDLSPYSKIILRADWMGNNVKLLLPVLKQCPELLNCMKPSSEILQYINEKYMEASPQNTIAIHVRVRQPGDIMANMKHPNPEWFVEAINAIGVDKLERIILISGISTAHEDGKQYFNKIAEMVSLSFQKVKIVIMQNEPCYIDFFALSSMKNLVITNSSFSFMAALLGAAWGECLKIVLPDCLLDEFGININDVPVSGFSCAPVKESILSFQSL
jgi:hypothetical protein